MNKFKVIPRFAPALKLEDLRVFFKKMALLDIVEKFEEQFAFSLNRRYALFTPSGRYAFQLILRNISLRDKRQKVIIPSFTHPSVPLTVLNLKLKPVFFDVGKETFLMEIKNFQKYNDCLAIVPTNLFGFSVDMETVVKFASENGLFIIEDCAQSLGAKYKNKFLGSFGYASFYSFSLTKNFTTLSGGMLVTDDFALKSEYTRVVRKDKKIIFEIIKAFLFILFSNPLIFLLFLYPLLLASKEKDLLEIIFKEKVSFAESFSSRIEFPSSLKAKMGLAQLELVEEINRKRRENGEYLSLLLKNLKQHLEYPEPCEGSTPVYLSFPILVKKRARLKKYLLRKGVDSTTGFLKACHLLAPFKNLNFRCPNAKSLEQNILHLPVHQGLTRPDLEYIAQVLKDYFNKYED